MVTGRARMPFGGVPQFSKGQEATCIVPCQIVKDVWNQEWRARYFRTWYLKGVGDVSMPRPGKPPLPRRHVAWWKCYGKKQLKIRRDSKICMENLSTSQEIFWWFVMAGLSLIFCGFHGSRPGGLLYILYSNLYESFCPHLLVSFRFLHGTAKPEILHPLMMPLSPTPRITPQRNPMRSWAYQWEGGQSWDLCLHVIRKFGSHWWYPQQKSMVRLESFTRGCLVWLYL